MEEIRTNYNNIGMPIYDSADRRYKCPIGSAQTGERITLFLRTEMPCSSAWMEYCLAGQSERTRCMMTWIGNEGSVKVFRLELSLDQPGVFLYHFVLVFKNGGYVYVNRGNHFCGELNSYEGNFWQQTVYDKRYTTPQSFKGGVMYQILPDRFYNSQTKKKNVPKDRILRNDWGGQPYYLPDTCDKEVICTDYFGGDLKGIAQKLDYLHSLGVTIIYLNPIFEAHSNHRYNTANFMKIDPVLGTNQDFADLCEKAHEYGIKIILDGVFSHVGSDSIYFNKEQRYKSKGAFHHEDSPYRSWFTFDNSPLGYEAWWNVKTLPEVRETEPSYKEFICGENGVLAYWLGMGADGFRLDVADELPDEFLDAVRARLKSVNPDALLIGEVWEDATTKISYNIRRRYLLGNQLDSVMNYPFRTAILEYLTNKNAALFYDRVFEIVGHYPKPSLQTLMNFLSTHDVIRAVNLLSGAAGASYKREDQAKLELTEEEYERGCRLLHLAFYLLFTLPGIPSVYYGDEAGMTGWSDPFNRGCYPWGSERMDLIETVRNLSQIRQDYREVFACGDLIPVCFDNGKVIYRRMTKHGSITVAINLSQESFALDRSLYQTILMHSGDQNGEGVERTILQPGEGLIAWKSNK